MTEQFLAETLPYVPERVEPNSENRRIDKDLQRQQPCHDTGPGRRALTEVEPAVGPGDGNELRDESDGQEKNQAEESHQSNGDSANQHDDTDANDETKYRASR